jgi:hypothetical protein
VTAVAVPLGGHAARARMLVRFLEEECFALLMAAGCLAAVARVLPSFIVQDTWLALADGREIAGHGLPHADHMTVWTEGARWIDQQWLAHLLFYGVSHAGGIRLVVAVGLAASCAAVAGAAIAARAAGASSRSVALALPTGILVAPWLLQVRTQSPALPLFVLVYALLASDSRKPSRRVLLTIPVLVLWGNLHGSVAMAAGLVAVHGVLLAIRHGLRARGALLAVAAPAAILVTPYGVDVVGYYRWMLVSSPLADYVVEWRPATPSLVTAGFFAAAFATAALMARHWRLLAPFERVALPLLILATMLATRNAAWFGLALVMSLPRLIDAAWKPTTQLTPRLRRLNRWLSTTAVVVALVAVATTFMKPASWFERVWPVEAAQAAVKAAGPHGLVLADDRHADWLLWKDPSLRGRLAYDVRFELFTKARLDALRDFRWRIGDDWRRCATGYRVLTFSLPSDGAAVREFSRGRAGRILYRDGELVVVARTTPGPVGTDPCSAGPHPTP